MKLPFTIDRNFTTELSRNQVNDLLNNLTTEKKFSGLRMDKIIVQTYDTGFTVERNTYGVDGFTLERYPGIQGIYMCERPLTLNIVVKPNYFEILFFAVFLFTFMAGGIFVDKMLINGVLRSPTIAERMEFAGFGGILPGLWCYFGHSRPIYKAKRWIIEKLKLNEVIE